MVDVNSGETSEMDATHGLRGHAPQIVRYREERSGCSGVRQMDEVPGLAGQRGAATGRAKLR
jgi:competence protein ComEA